MWHDMFLGLIFGPGFLTPKVWFVFEATVFFVFCFFWGGGGRAGVYPYLMVITVTFKFRVFPPSCTGIFNKKVPKIPYYTICLV